LNAPPPFSTEGKSRELETLGPFHPPLSPSLLSHHTGCSFCWRCKVKNFGAPKLS
jgi:hypothetical protein